MTEAELRSALERLAAMSERCEHVISRNRPLTLDEPPQRTKPVRQVQRQQVCASQPRTEQAPRPIASGQLAGNEMRIGNGYSPRPHESECCDPDGMWAAFETEFDEMVKGMH